MSEQATQMQTNGNGGKKPAAALTLRDFLNSEAAKTRLAEVARGHLKPEDLIRFALLAQSRQPDLAKCSQASVLRALMDAAALGIRPGGLMGRGYLVPRWNNKAKPKPIMECQFDPGYRGLVDIARRSGEISRIFAEPVKEKDFFDYEIGDNPFIKHKPLITGPRGKLIAAYAVCIFKDGAKQMDVMLLEDIEKRRLVSAAKGGPWASWYDEMAKKTVLRSLCKLLPYNEALEKALELSTDAESEEPIGRMEDVSLEPKQPRSKAVTERIKKAAQADALPDVDLEVQGEESETHDPETGEVPDDEMSDAAEPPAEK